MILTVGILLVVSAGAALLMRPGGQSADQTPWDSYLSRKTEATERLLGPMARAFSRGGAVARMTRDRNAPETLLRNLELGRAFDANPGIFYSMQLAAGVVASALIAVSFLESLSGLNRLVLVGVAVIVAIWPYNRVVSKAREKTRIVLNELPDFAELLLMTLASTSVPNALAFTVERSQGYVADEMRDLVRLLNGPGRGREQETFAAAAGRLGTAEGREFVAALQSAYLEGVTAANNIKSQVENLRTLQFQQQRARAKRLPVSLVVTFAVHFMPLLFILAFLPVLSSLSGLR